MQLATKETVYLIPIHWEDLLKKTTSNTNWKNLSDILNNVSIIKVGFDLPNDILVAKEVMPKIHINMAGWFDLKMFWDKKLDDFTNFEFPFDDGETLSKSVKHMVQLCFKKPLGKLETFSNWKHRSLNEDQEEYAALDALCPVLIFELLHTQLGEEFETHDIRYQHVELCYAHKLHLIRQQKQGRKKVVPQVRRTPHALKLKENARML